MVGLAWQMGLMLKQQHLSATSYGSQLKRGLTYSDPCLGFSEPTS